MPRPAVGDRAADLAGQEDPEDFPAAGRAVVFPVGEFPAERIMLGRAAAELRMNAYDIVKNPGMSRSAMNLKRHLLRRAPQGAGREANRAGRAAAQAWKSAGSTATPISKYAMTLFRKMFLRKENAKPAFK
ncbi:MAG: hypothetical protein Q8R35_01685 [bacterium]|nr:hypothetical protein [bacterium]